MRPSGSLFFAHLAMILSLGLSGCGGGGASTTSENAQILSLAGNWQASTISNLGYNTLLSGTLVQTGSQISGTLNISGSPCATSGTLTGTINNSSVTMVLTEGIQNVSLQGAVAPDGNSITGTYQTPVGGCTNGDSGTFSATRNAVIAPPPTVTAVSVSCSPAAIQVNQTSKCSVIVSGGGNFSSSVTWSVDNGSIDQNGNYTAPATPTTATITATSVQDKTKSGLASVTITPQTSAWDGGPSPTIPITSQCFSGDFNGDKKTDVACYTGGGSWTVALSTGSGWNSEVWNGGPGPALPVTDQCVTGDFNGDGKTDLACYTGNTGSWNIALSTGTGWQSEFWNGGPLLVDEWNVVPVPGQCFAADFNGDGKTDLACSDGVDGTWSVALSTGSGWNTESWSGGPVVPLPMTQQCLTGDMNGDGKADLACWTGEGGGWAVALSTGTSWNASIWSGGPIPVDEWNVIPVPNQCFAADFNGDKKTDIVCSDGTNSIWNVSLSTGSGWNTESWSGGPVVPLPMTQQCLTGDMNGDGKADLACWTGEGGGWAVALSTGTSWNASIWSGGPIPVDEWNVIPVPNQCFAADFNADGLTDLACYSGSGGNWNVALSTGTGW